MRLTIEQREGGIGVARMDGRLDLLTAVAAKQRLSEAVAAGTPRLVVDLGAVAFVDSSGLGALIGGLKAARLAGGDLRLARPPEQARVILNLTTLDRVLKLYDTVEEAVAAYTGG
jgi:anti-anti-sigma factor